MKYFIPFFLLLLSTNCSDGDLQIETLDFDSATLQFCETSPTTGSTLFFKLNGDEALVLTLQSGILKNEDSGGILTSDIPGQSQLIYRIFSDDVTKNYFCASIPPATPTVLEEITAQAGEIRISTIQSASDTTLYEHTIELSGISLVNSQGERITDLSINNFGTISTSQ